MDVDDDLIQITKFGICFRSACLKKEKKPRSVREGLEGPSSRNLLNSMFVYQ